MGANRAENTEKGCAEAAGFQRARTKEQIELRKEAIINATERLYQQGGLNSLNFKAISEMTSISRQSIYNYYKTREEILLDVLMRDQKAWEQDMYTAMTEFPTLSKQEYAMMMTSIFSDHGMMLELTSMLFNMIELNVSLEKLTEFRKSSIDVYHILMVSIMKYFPTAGKDVHASFVSTIFAFAVGLYPMNHMSDKHRTAERLADAFYVYPDGENINEKKRSVMFETQFYAGLMLMLSSM